MIRFFGSRPPLIMRMSVPTHKKNLLVRNVVSMFSHRVISRARLYEVMDMSVPAHKSLLVRNVVSMLSHRVISRARLYEVMESTYVFSFRMVFFYLPGDHGLDF